MVKRRHGWLITAVKELKQVLIVEPGMAKEVPFESLSYTTLQNVNMNMQSLKLSDYSNNQCLFTVCITNHIGIPMAIASATCRYYYL